MTKETAWFGVFIILWVVACGFVGAAIVHFVIKFW